MKKKYNYFYKITNNINNHFYYGVHCTDNLDDGYMGSGTRLHYAFKKYGIENFSKEIIKFFDNIKEAYEYEAEIVTEDLIHNSNCYNIQCGGEGWNSYGTVSVQDKNGNCFRCSKYDKKYLNGEYISVAKNQVTVKDKSNNCFNVNINDSRYISGELVGVNKDKIIVKDKNGNCFRCDKKDPRYLSGELVGVSKNLIVVRNKKNNYYSVCADDPRYLSGELVSIFKGKKHKKETIQKIKETFKKIKHAQGEKNSQYGTCWCYKIENNKPINIKIKKEQIDDYIKDGWIKGRKIKYIK